MPSKSLKLSDVEKAVALAAQFNADASAVDLAKPVGVRPHTVNYALRGLIERQVLRPWLAINHLALGYEQFDVFFSLSSANVATKNKLLAALAADSNILWYVELGGDFQYAFSLYAKSVTEAAAFLENLAQKSKASLVRKQISVVVFFALFKKKYLSPDRPALSRGSIQFKRPAVLALLDEMDRTVLAGLYDCPSTSHPALARMLGLARSTLELRIRRLMEKGVLLAFIYHISAARLGMHSYKVLIFARGVRPDLKEKLFHYADLSKNIVNFSVCFGSWDYEIDAEVSEPGEISFITSDLYDRFGTEIDQIQVLPLFKRNVSARFMRPLKASKP
jgi:DNA-binding Lrp family transcriptional regulator